MRPGGGAQVAFPPSPERLGRAVRMRSAEPFGGRARYVPSNRSSAQRLPALRPPSDSGILNPTPPEHEGCRMHEIVYFLHVTVNTSICKNPSKHNSKSNVPPLSFAIHT